ncbi:MAG: lactate utilization protein [Planctomycetaceae bacterium]|jgi:hypothetical protein|nr:lactate utilization protein [Planctomycetaceae bacterium]
MPLVKEFLDNIRNSIFAGNPNYQRLELPPLPDVWQDDIDQITKPSENELLEQFCLNLEKLNGESIICGDLNNLILQVAKILCEQESDEIKIMVSSNQLTRHIADELQSAVDNSGIKKRLTFYFEPLDRDGDGGGVGELELPELASCDFGIVAAEALLSDTGSGVFQADSRFERLAVYLPPISIIIAGRSKLEKNLPAAWQNLNAKIKNQKTGEFVIVTGPSRTADIEKILILGVHGPRRILFMIYQDK